MVYGDIYYTDIDCTIHPTLPTRRALQLLTPLAFFLQVLCLLDEFLCLFEVLCLFEALSAALWAPVLECPSPFSDRAGAAGVDDCAPNRVLRTPELIVNFNEVNGI